MGNDIWVLEHGLKVMLNFQVQMQVRSRYKMVKLFLNFSNVMLITCVCPVRDIKSGRDWFQPWPQAHTSPKWLRRVPEWQSGFSRNHGSASPGTKPPQMMRTVPANYTFEEKPREG